MPVSLGAEPRYVGVHQLGIQRGWRSFEIRTRTLGQSVSRLDLRQTQTNVHEIYETRRRESCFAGLGILGLPQDRFEFTAVLVTLEGRFAQRETLRDASPLASQVIRQVLSLRGEGVAGSGHTVC